MAYWEPYLPALTRRHRVLIWDVRGFGDSDKPPGPYSVSGFAADLAALVGALGVRSAHFAGISMGGVITQRLALDFPHLLRSMILVSTSSQVSEAAAQGWDRLADLVEKRGFSPSAAAAARSFSPAFAEAHADAVEEASRITAANDPRAYGAAARAVARYHWTEELAGVQTPTLILQGADDQLTPPGGSVIMSRRLPRSCLLIVPAAGHNLPIEQPIVFESAISAFTAPLDWGADG